MDATTYVTLSAQISLQKQLETVANNVANASTAGFKADRPLFQSYIDQASEPDGGVAFVQDAATYVDRSSGPIESTGNPLDIALNGDGYLAVATPQGTSDTRATVTCRSAPTARCSAPAGTRCLARTAHRSKCRTGTPNYRSRPTEASRRW